MRDDDVEKVVEQWADEAVEDCLDSLWSLSGEPGFRTDLKKRFRDGRKRFGGEFNLNGTDWVEERREELIDAVIYTVFDMLKSKGQEN